MVTVRLGIVEFHRRHMASISANATHRLISYTPKMEMGIGKFTYVI